MTTGTRFVVAGASVAALYWLATFALLRSGLGASAAAMIAYLPAVAFAYLAQKRWTFRSRSAHRRTLPRYLVAQLVNLGVAGAAASLGEALGLPSAAIAALSTLASSASAYLLSSRWVFSAAGDSPAPDLVRLGH